MKQTSYEVPTKVLIAQARTTEHELGVEATKPRREALVDLGIDAKVLGEELGTATRRLEELEAEQERAKTHYLREAREDQAVVEEGYRFKLSLEARARAYIARHGDDDDLRGRLRFGHLKSARARGLVYELRTVLPEVEALLPKLKDVGVDEALVAKGYDILARLAVDKEETAEAKAKREQVTRAVRAGEKQVSRLLAQLTAADEAIALENPTEGRVFRLDVIGAERGRVRASREARAAATVTPEVDDD